MAKYFSGKIPFIQVTFTDTDYQCLNHTNTDTNYHIVTDTNTDMGNIITD